jgi:hypothetical protein
MLEVSESQTEDASQIGKNLATTNSHIKQEVLKDNSIQVNACQGNQINLDTPQPLTLLEDDINLSANRE